MAYKKLISFRSKKKKTPGGWEEKQKKSSKPNRRNFLYLTAGGISVGLFVGIVIFSVYKWLAVSDFFQITSIKIEGVRRLEKQQIVELSEITIRTNLLAMNAERVQKKIEAHDWVQKAVLKRGLPSDLVITILEREPAALVNTSKGLFFVDKNGVVFAPANPPEDLDYPIITGLESAADIIVDTKINDWQEKGDSLAKALLFIKHAGRGSSSLPRQNISEIKVTENGEYILFLADHPFPVYLGKDVTTKRYYRLAKVLYWLYKKREFSNVNFIRMDYMDNKVLVGKIDAG